MSDLRAVIRVTLLTVSCLLNFAFAETAAKVDRVPNFLFVIADDCTHRDIGCYGGQALTPNIDRLAAEGMRFTQCFQAAPMCSPTRHNIYTGLYPVKSGAYPNHTFAKDGTQSVVHYLKPHGYRVALSGKTHISPKEVFPFEYSGSNNPDLKAIDKLFSESSEARTPFCLFACSNEPHTPYTKGDPSQYDVDRITLPANFVDTPETRAEFVKYLAEVTYYDWQVGECLKLLDKYGLADNTLVVVVSEQGSSFPFAKWTCYDSGLQSALIARWPGRIQPGETAHAMVEYVDVLPTFLDAAGLDVPQVLDGRSFLPVLTGEATRHKDFVFGLMTTRGIINGSDHFGIRSVRSDKYKYIVNLTPEVKFQNACVKSESFVSWQKRAEAGDADAAGKVHRYEHRPAEELYDVTQDVLEWNNLARDPKLAAVKAELKQQLAGWMAEQGDKGAQTELEAREHQGRNRRKVAGSEETDTSKTGRNKKSANTRQ
ncbi:MAG: sulfatase [Planctomycetota bacterium]|nr:sulfatase [Planctomycetota bacterium]MDA1161753.1 sulfatase [Planctomycetota bacterium]